MISREVLIPSIRNPGRLLSADGVWGRSSIITDV